MIDTELTEGISSEDELSEGINSENEEQQEVDGQLGTENKTQKKIKKLLSERNEARKKINDEAAQKEAYRLRIEELESQIETSKIGKSNKIDIEGYAKAVVEKELTKVKLELSVNKEKQDLINEFGEDFKDFIEDKYKEYPQLSSSDMRSIIVGKQQEVLQQSQQANKIVMSGNRPTNIESLDFDKLSADELTSKDLLAKLAPYMLENEQ